MKYEYEALVEGYRQGKPDYSEKILSTTYSTGTGVGIRTHVVKGRPLTALEMARTFTSLSVNFKSSLVNAFYLNTH